MVQKTVLITGSTRSIGLKLAEHYIKSGWNVIGAARDPATADQLKALSPYKIVQLDSSDEASILNAAKALEGEAIDLLINNAGILLGSGTLVSTTKEDMLKQFEVNSVGPFLVTRAFIPHLKAAVAKHGSAYVAQISSVVGSITQNFGGFYGYRASKAALNMINSSLAIDLKNDQIGAFALNPGYVQTDMNKGEGEITVETSVNGLVSVIDKFTLEDTDKLYNYTGEILPW
ncbi:Short chain dehydrogenase, partial [Globisporangium splendens]